MCFPGNSQSVLAFLPFCRYMLANLMAQSKKEPFRSKGAPTPGALISFNLKTALLLLLIIISTNLRKQMILIKDHLFVD